MKNLLLTRYLYATDEVILSLLNSLLNKKDLSECYWWSYELYYSEINIKPIIWQIYYDFYAQLNPYLEKYIQTKFDKMDKGDDTSLAFIIRNLFARQSTDTVFCLRLFSERNKLPSIIYKGKTPQWLEAYDKKYHNLLRSLKSRNWINTIYFLKQFINQNINQSNNNYNKPNNDNISEQLNNLDISSDYSLFENLYLTICKFIDKEEEFINLDFNEEKTLELWNKIKYNNYLHRLLALLAFVWSPVENIHTNRLFITPTKDELSFILKTNEPIELNKFGNSQIYNTIPFKRIYKINEEISCFALKRDYYDYEDLIDQYLLHWEYHCSKTPLWIRRFKRFGVCFDDESNKPIFPNDDYQELFYDTYGYEMDEPHVRASSQLSFPMLLTSSKDSFNLCSWLEKVFENTNEEIRLGIDKIKVSIKKRPYYYL